MKHGLMCEYVQLKYKQEPHPPLHLMCDDVSVT